MQRFFTYRVLLGLALLLAVLMLLPSLWTGLLVTDYYHKLLLTGASPIPPPHDYSLFGMFSFTSGSPERIQQIINLGALPWWSALDVQVSFFRPLSELTHWVDYQLWPDHPGFMHAQSLLWYLADILIVSLLLRRIYREKSPAIAGIATLLFAICGAHSVTVDWIACRNTLVATFFGVLVLYLHDRWREERRPQWLILSLLALVTALLSAEYGLSCIPFLVGYALFLERGTLKSRILSITPALLIALLYLAFYLKAGFGAKNSELYTSPHDPVAFIHAVLTRIPELLGAHFSGLTLFLLIQFKQHKMLINLVYLLLALPVIPVLFRSREARFLMFGVLGAMVPISAETPADRVLIFSSTGVMAIVAEAVLYWRERFRGAGVKAGGKVLAGAAFSALVLCHFVLSPLQFLPLYIIPVQLQQILLLNPVASIQQQPDLTGKTVVLMNPTPLMPTCLYMPIMLTNGKPAPKNVLALSPGNEPVTVTRVDDRTLRVTPKSGYMIGTDSWYPHPHKEPFKVGETFHLSEVTITVESLDAKGGPMTALFRFDQPLDSGNLVWLRFRSPKAKTTNSGTYSPWQLPKVGETVVLKRFG